jgi:hypothetical protein
MHCSPKAFPSSSPPDTLPVPFFVILRYYRECLKTQGNLSPAVDFTIHDPAQAFISFHELQQ